MKERFTERPLLTNASLNEAIDFLRSPAYQKMLATANMPDWMRQMTDLLITGPDKYLEQRALWLEDKARRALNQFYRERGDVVVPFSGGYDSSAIAFLTLDLLRESGRKVVLMTAVSGMTQRGKENPALQAQLIANRLGMPVEHLFLDISAFFREFVIKPALQDTEKLGWPSICPSCKALMELAMARAAQKLGAGHLAWGYNQYQAALQWSEQHPAQREVMAEYMGKFFPDINSGSPFFEIITLPPDPVLLFSQLGLPVRNSHGEGRCLAAGLNPKEIVPENLEKFITDKLASLTSGEIDATISLEMPQVPSLTEEIQALRQDSKFLRGIFDEKEHMQLRDRAFGNT